MSARESPHTQRYPLGFLDWPLGQQIAYLLPKHNRASLIRTCLAHTDLEHDTEIHEQTTTTKRQLAAMLIELEGVDHDRYPDEILDHNFEHQADYIAEQMTRPGLISTVVSVAGLGSELDHNETDRRLRKKELAAVYLYMEGVANVGGDSNDG